MRTRRVVHPVLTLALAVGVAGCGGGSSASETTKPVPSTSSWPSTVTPSAGDASEDPSSSTSTSAAEASGQGAEGQDETDDERALKAEQKKARPAIKAASNLADDLEKHRKSPKAKWWKAIKPNLSSNGIKQMKQKTPGTVGFTKVTDKPGLLISDTDMGSRYESVNVPTDKGHFLFLVERTGSGGSAKWKVASISKINGG